MLLRSLLFSTLLIPCAISMWSVSSASAATVAVIDSGLDWRHKDLQGQIFINPNDKDDGMDNDQNGYIDDIHGWNFAENNNEVIAYKYLGSFSNDPYKFFELQLKSFKGIITQDEKDWINSKRKDEKFMAELQKFGNFVHGTHVAGICVKDHKENQAIGIKLIPTESPLAVKKILAKNPELRKSAAIAGNESKVMKILLNLLARQQMKTMATVGAYTHSLHADVANGSFGTGYDQALMIVKLLYREILKKDPSEEEAKSLAMGFMNSLVAEGKAFVNAAPKTLFVFAAGNEGTDNDTLPTSPTNIKTANTISVAASFGQDSLAFFSNYGATLVEVAAPGVGILSTIPGGETMRVSGTSQAAPYVSNVAAEIKSINPKLSPAEVKQIIMGTVDRKSFLAGKVVSGGIVNPERAFEAARKSTGSPLSVSISSARSNVRDVRSDASQVHGFVQNRDVGMILPILPMFN
ncbi:MAG: S8 family serine peptidase [Methylotenera sp.]|nr:S8 family serine peptidase [Oligoflexia bacterium]